MLIIKLGNTVCTVLGVDIPSPKQMIGNSQERLEIGSNYCHGKATLRLKAWSKCSAVRAHAKELN